MVEGPEVGAAEVVGLKEIKDHAGMIVSQVGAKLKIVLLSINLSKIKAFKINKPLFNQVHNLARLTSNHIKATKVAFLIRYASLEQTVGVFYKAIAIDNILIKINHNNNNNLTQTLHHKEE